MTNCSLNDGVLVSIPSPYHHYKVHLKQDIDYTEYNWQYRHDYIKHICITSFLKCLNMQMRIRLMKYELI